MRRWRIERGRRGFRAVVARSESDEAIQSFFLAFWIASSQGLLAMTVTTCNPDELLRYPGSYCAGPRISQELIRATGLPLVPVKMADTLACRVRRGPAMNSLKKLCVLACGTLMLASAARAEGTFDMPAGAHFNQDKLAKITEFFNNEVATGKIAGADILIRQHGKPVYHQTFGVQDAVSKTDITDN